MAFLGALGTVFGFASTIALIVEHGGKLPRWPFTREHWQPKPSSEKKKDKKEDEVTEEDLVADELAQMAGGLKKRSLTNEDLELLEEALFRRSLGDFVKRDGKPDPHVLILIEQSSKNWKVIHRDLLTKSTTRRLMLLSMERLALDKLGRSSKTSWKRRKKLVKKSGRTSRRSLDRGKSKEEMTPRKWRLLTRRRKPLVHRRRPIHLRPPIIVGKLFVSLNSCV